MRTDSLVRWAIFRPAASGIHLRRFASVGTLRRLLTLVGAGVGTLMLAPGWNAYSQVVWFANDDASAVTNNDTGARVVPGGTFRASLYSAQDGQMDPSAFIPLGTNTGFGLPGRFNGGLRTTPFASFPGQQAMFQVRVWESVLGETYETALNAARQGQPGIFGRSIIIRVATGSIQSPGSLLGPDGLRSFLVKHTPRLISASSDTTVANSQALQLQVLFDALGEIRWFRNGQLISSVTGSNSTFDLGNVNALKIGKYTNVLLAPFDIITFPAGSPLIDIQINQEDGGSNPALRAFDQFVDAAGTVSRQSIRQVAIRQSRIRPQSAPARGYSGTQIFSTYGASKEPGEPNHCGQTGGASEWFAYQAPANGTLMIDTIGSDFDTVLAAYTGPGTDFASLVEKACDNNKGPANTSRVQFQAASNEVYWIAVDGVGGTNGTVQLNYNLGDPPAITGQPVSRTNIAGTSAQFSVTATGTAPLSYQWRFNDHEIGGATASSYTVPNVQAADEGSYTVVLTNLTGAVTSALATLTVLVPPQIGNGTTGAPPSKSGTSFELSFQSRTNQSYMIEYKDDLITGNWVTLQVVPGTGGEMTISDSNATAPKRFYHVRLQL